jgi:hypothetical protein
MDSLIVAIRAAAGAYAPLTSLLGVGSAIRISTLQLIQGGPFPGIALQLISNPSDYVVNTRLATSTARVQHTVFGMTPGGNNAWAVVQALRTFYDQFNAIGISGLSTYPTRIVGVTELGIPETQPQTFLIRLDAMIFYNE